MADCPRGTRLVVTLSAHRRGDGDAVRHFYHLTRKSDNRKTGPIPVWSTGRTTCPNSCPLRDNCYGDGWPLNQHFEHVTNGSTGINLPLLLKGLVSLDADRCRGLDVGDLPGDRINLDRSACVAIAKSLVHVNHAWCFSHYPLNRHNVAVLRELIGHGLIVNASCHNLPSADAIADLDLPIACTVPRGGLPRGTRTPAGRRCVQCPASLSEYITCATCGGNHGPLCARADRDYVIMFPAHGKTAKHVESLWRE